MRSYLRSDVGINSSSKNLLLDKASEEGGACDLIQWIIKVYPFDVDYLPIILVSSGFFITTLIGAVESYRCRKAILSATSDDADAEAPLPNSGAALENHNSINSNNNSNSNTPSGTPPTSSRAGAVSGSGTANTESSENNTNVVSSIHALGMTPSSFSTSGRKILQPSFMHERQLNQQHQSNNPSFTQESLIISVGSQQFDVSITQHEKHLPLLRHISGSGGVAAHYHSQQRGSKGDQTRLMFYNLLTAALLTRCIFLPWEGIIYYKGAGYHQELICLNSPACIMARSLPDVAFASAFSLLVFFYAQLAGTASAGGPRGLSLVLSKKGLFATGNAVVYAVYCVLLACAFLQWIPLLAFQLCIWALLFLLYGSLLFVLTYFGPVLVTLLGPSLIKPTSRGLSVRLIGMCLVCTLVFLSRMICFGLAMLHRDGRFTHGLVPYWTLPPPVATDVIISEYLDDAVLLRDLFGYALLELLPSLAILLMMHQRRRPNRSGGNQKILSTNSPLAYTSGSVNSREGASYGSVGGGETRPLLSQQSTLLQTSHGIRRAGSGGAYYGEKGVRRMPGPTNNQQTVSQTLSLRPIAST